MSDGTKYHWEESKDSHFALVTDTGDYVASLGMWGAKWDCGDWPEDEAARAAVRTKLNEVNDKQSEPFIVIHTAYNELADRLGLPHWGETAQKSKGGKYVTVTVLQDDEMPAAGAYLAGSATDGHAIVKLNVGFHLCACVETGKTSAPEVRKAVAESLAHELMHVCQELMGDALDESWVERGIAGAREHLSENPDCIVSEDQQEAFLTLLDAYNHLAERHGEPRYHPEGVV